MGFLWAPPIYPWWSSVSSLVLSSALFLLSALLLLWTSLVSTILTQLLEYSLLPEDLQQLLGPQLQDLSWTMFPLITLFLSTLLPSSLVHPPFYMASYGAAIGNNLPDLDTLLFKNLYHLLYFVI